MPNMGTSELTRTSCINSGTDLNKSKSCPSHRLAHQGAVARKTPKTAPASEPENTAIAVINIVQLAPCASNQKSLEVSAVLKIISC